MLILVQIDLSSANIRLFDDYETRVLALLEKHHGKLLERLRSTNGQCEFHLLHFPSADALNAFRADPAREALQELWGQSGASSQLNEVERLIPM